MHKTIEKDGKPLALEISNPTLLDICDKGISSAKDQKRNLEEELKEITSRYRIKMQEMDALATQHHTKKRKAVALDIANFIESDTGWKVGSNIEFQGKAYALTLDGIDVRSDYDYCSDPEYIASRNVSPYAQKRPAWSATISLGNTGRGPEVAHLWAWQDNGGIYAKNYSSEASPTTAPAGSQFPTYEQIVNTLRGTGVKLEEKGFFLAWDFKHKVTGDGRGNIGKSSRIGAIHYHCTDLCSLRNMAFHQNRYNALVKRFTTRGYLDTHEYQDMRDPEGTLSRLCATFNFKLIEGEEEACRKRHIRRDRGKRPLR